MNKSKKVLKEYTLYDRLEDVKNEYYDLIEDFVAKLGPNDRSTADKFYKTAVESMDKLEGFLNIKINHPDNKF